MHSTLSTIAGIFTFLLAFYSPLLGQTQKYTVSQDAKGKFALTNNQTNVVVYSKCTSIEPLSKGFPQTDESYKDFYAITEKKNLILFNTRTDSAAFKIEGEELNVREVFDAYQAPPVEFKKMVIDCEIKVKDRTGHVLVNVKTGKVLAFRNIYSAAFTRDRKFLVIETERLAKLMGETLGFKDTYVKDLNGKTIVPPISESYDRIVNPVELKDAFLVRVSRNFNKYYGIISKSGDTSIPFIYKWLNNPEGTNYLVAQDTVGRTGVVNMQHRVLVPFEKCESFLSSDQGVFFVGKNKSELIVIDTNNTILVPAGTYTGVRDIYPDEKSHYIVKKQNGLEGIYDTKKRQETFACEYNIPYEDRIRSNELSRLGCQPAEKNGRWGLMNFEKGIVAIPFEYEANSVKFDDNYDRPCFYLEKEGRHGVVSISGEVMVPFEYDEIKPMGKQYFRVKNKGLYGLVDATTHKIILPAEYSKIDYNLGLEKIEGDTLKKGRLTKEGEVKWD